MKFAHVRGQITDEELTSCIKDLKRLPQQIEMLLNNKTKIQRFANRYLAALEERRYLADTKILEAEAFTSLVQAYYNAKKKNLTECTLLQIECDSATFKRSEEILLDNLRQTDYLGTMDDGKLYVLLSNTVKTEAQIVVNRFMKAGFNSRIIDRIAR